MDAAVTAAKLATDGPITILAHSAGGWLSRVYLLVSMNLVPKFPVLDDSVT